jgi:indolepyruvate ferredoxin oxidoreductase
MNHPAERSNPASDASLDDKYSMDRTAALMNGRQALVRLPLAQRALDAKRGLKTAGLISGYRGSPLGTYDLELWKASSILRANDIVFQPGLNEDLALTALAGSQQLDWLPGKRFDGVFGIWYGKGPGVDRSGDAIKHANLQGVSATGGILLAFGDDHTGKSSTTAHQSDITLASWAVPVLYPSSVSEILTLGLAGIALSRYSGLLVGLKLTNETADGTEVVTMNEPVSYVEPDLPQPQGGVHIRKEMIAMRQQDMRLQRFKLPRAQAFARANGLDRMAFGARRAKFVIASAGKTYADVLGALSLLGICENTAQRLGIGVFKVALIFPLDPVTLHAVTEQAEEILFVEEKRPHMEIQAAALLYARVVRPRISGKTTPEGETLLPSDLPLNAAEVAKVIATRLKTAFPALLNDIPNFAERSAVLFAETPESAAGSSLLRRPAFCAGCPHNTSTNIPEGSFTGTGIGCHTMVLFQPERRGLPVAHMGGEGAQWIGLAPFTETAHIFQNLGDGTYSHSGSLAIRAAVLAKVNITYKILLNDAVAMTGGQPVEGHLTAARVAEQVLSEGASRVVIVSDDPARTRRSALPGGIEVRHRRDLLKVQESLRSVSGVSVLIYEQVCAAEKRRRRKTKSYPDPARRLFINSAVCEGCGDCSTQSNCIAIAPLETDLGRKRKIDQSACNKDFSCQSGFCPSFVSVIGGAPRRASASPTEDRSAIPSPTTRPLGDGFDLIIAGIGGTGVVTLSAVLGMAARLEGLGASLYDMTGLSQKAGQVFSHVRIRPRPGEYVPAQVGEREAHVILACDLIAAANADTLKAIMPDKTLVFGNRDLLATADFQTNKDQAIPADSLIERLRAASRQSPALISAGRISLDLLGDSIGANFVLLGFAWQSGSIPLRLESIEKAVSLNGKAVSANLQAFNAGRRAALQPAPVDTPKTSLPQFIAERTLDLKRYWNEAYARRYRELMSAVVQAAERVSDGEAFTWAVARSAYKLMSYKDEYEIARLYTDGRFQAVLEQGFSGYRSIKIHLAPPVLGWISPRFKTRKIAFGRWILPALHLLHACRGFREGPLDIFARLPERRLERELREAYLAQIASLLKSLSGASLQRAVEIAESPMKVRGFGHVKVPAARTLLDQLCTLNRAATADPA